LNYNGKFNNQKGILWTFNFLLVLILFPSFQTLASAAFTIAHNLISSHQLHIIDFIQVRIKFGNCSHTRVTTVGLRAAWFCGMVSSERAEGRRILQSFQTNDIGLQK
jgi:hypothetical protein